MMSAPGGKRRIRAAGIEDIQGIAKVRVRGWQRGYRGVMPQTYLDAMSVNENVERARSWDWSAPTSQHWVCVEEEEIVGWTSAFLPSRDADVGDTVSEIAACYALPEVWGTGVGHQMMLEATRFLRERGATAIVLWVLEKNQRAQRFYLRQGFQLDGKSKPETFIPGTSLISVRMRRAL